MKNVASQMKSTLHTQSFSVPYEYHVWFTSGLFDVENPVFRESVCKLEPAKRHRILTFVDAGVLNQFPELPTRIQGYCEHHHESIELVAAPIEVPGGERVKVDMQHVEKMQQILHEHRIDRHSFVVGIGGGAVLDAVGWVAATAHRGVRHIRVPTTVLSQNDSGVGVKNGVNFYGQKNYMGCFAPPFAVLNDFDYVIRLPRRDQIAGIAEAVKVALIRDAEFFDWLEENADPMVSCERPAMERMIQRCAELHMHQIAKGGDPFEMGSARPLDYGHWAAHKIESMTNYEIRHGEAVAVGIALDARYSVLTGLLPEGDDVRICTLLERLGFVLWHDSLMESSSDGQREVMRGLNDFKEHLGGELTITLLKEIGVGIEVHEMVDSMVFDAIDWLHARHENLN